MTTPNGHLLQFSNSCEAECHGYFHYQPCDSMCICPDVWDPVCVMTQGVIIQFSNACQAECHGYTDFVPCDTLCDPAICPEIFDPVCVISTDGTIHQFDNLCLAICAGFEHFVPCDTTCICPTVYDPVCVVGPNGHVLTFSNSCEAVCAGYTTYFTCTGNPNNPGGYEASPSYVIASPNPSQGHFDIVSNIPGDDEIGYTITDINGKKVYQEYTRDRRIHVDLSAFASGMYFVVAESAGVLQSTKVIIR